MCVHCALILLPPPPSLAPSRRRAVVDARKRRPEAAARAARAAAGEWEAAVRTGRTPLAEVPDAALTDVWFLRATRAHEAPEGEPAARWAAVWSVPLTSDLPLNLRA